MSETKYDPSQEMPPRISEQPTISDEPRTVHCLVCRKDLEFNRSLVNGGGFVEISFHYGSKFDQCHGFAGRGSVEPDAQRFRKLLACDKIEGFICEQCFTERAGLLRGFTVETERTENRKV